MNPESDGRRTPGHPSTSSRLFLESCTSSVFAGGVTPVDTELVTRHLAVNREQSLEWSLDQGLRVALVHPSYLHGHRMQAPNATRGVLRALETLGSSWLTREIALAFYHLEHYDGPAKLSKAVEFGRTSVVGWVSGITWLMPASAFGKSLLVDGPPPSAQVRVFFQLVGLLCLLGAERTAKGLVYPFLIHLTSAIRTQIADPAGLLQEELAKIKAPLACTYERGGPDNAPIFRATLTSTGSRVVAGEGGSKKAAKSAAAIEFMRRYIPGVLNPTLLRPPIAPDPIASTNTPAHRRVVGQVAKVFQLNDDDTPLISQALTHASWAYENSAEMRRVRQQDNQVLGLVGSHVLAYESALAAARPAVETPPEEFALQTLMRDSYASAFLDANLGAGLLVGAGQQKVGLTTEVASNAFQALMAAVYISRGTPRSLLEHWPSDWDEMRSLIAPRRVREKDPTTHLQAVMSVAQVAMDYRFTRRGPDNEIFYTAALTLRSEALKRELSVHGAPERGKTKAKHSASQQVIESLTTLENAESIMALVRAKSREAALATFLLAHFASVSETYPAMARPWKTSRFFGAHLTGDPPALTTFGQAADALLDGQRLVSPDPNKVAEFVRVALSSDRTAQTFLRTELETALDWASQLEDAAEIVDLDVSRLAHLCGAFRALGMDQSEGSLQEAADDWSFIYRGRVAVSGELPVTALSSREQAILDAVVKTLLKGVEQIRVSPTTEGHLVFSSPRLEDSEAESLIRIWGEISPRLRIARTGQGIQVRFLIGSHTNVGPIEQGIRLALLPPSSPLNRAIADNLHLLKNHVDVAQQVIHRPASTRTAQLQIQLDASKHLDQVKALAKRIAATSSLLRTTGDEATPLSAFLRQYAIGIFSTLPTNISLQQPAAAHNEVTVAFDESSLRDVLDNLVNNARDVMSAGGTISLKWTHDEAVAVIEVADDGPGVPIQIVEALRSGRPVESTKVGGNGMGLVGVRTQIQRVGGEFDLVSSAKGAVWHLTLPLTLTPPDVMATEEETS